MLKKYNYKLLVMTLAIITLFAASCSKQLDLKPTDNIYDPNAFQSVSDLNGGLLGAYVSLSTSSIYSVALTSDECNLPSENSTGRGVATFRWQYDGSSSTITGNWGENYVTIDRVNRVLSYVDKVKVKNGEEELKNQYKGELLALRGFCHLELLRYFAAKYENTALGVPYMEASVVSAPKRLSFSETISKIKTDLTAAKALIPASFDDNARITINAIAAIQARVALYERNWDDAIKYSTEVIEAVPLADRDAFPKVWTDDSNDEVIWKQKRSADDSSLGDYFNSRRIAYYAPAFKLIDTYDKENDIRYEPYILFDDERGSGKSEYLINKYRTGSLDILNVTDNKLFRTGEMYLIRAEAYAEKENVPLAAQDLNDLRAARIKDYINEDFANKDAVITAIMLERYKELAFEGHRFFDLRRRNLPIERGSNDTQNTLGAIKLNPTDKQYVYPIPNNEIRANKNIIQNPLY